MSAVEDHYADLIHCGCDWNISLRCSGLQCGLYCRGGHAVHAETPCGIVILIQRH